MKTKTSLLLIAVFVASHVLGFAQTTTTNTDPTNVAPAAAVSPTVVAPATPETVIITTEEVAAAPDAAAAVSTNGADEMVPLITIDDASLPDAIKTLARQAGINFQFDPVVLNPPPDATGKIPPQPTVSFRWENVTAMEALMAILENNKLQLIRDPKTKIARVTKKDATALEPLFTKVFQLQYSSPSNLVAILTNTISSRGRVVPDVRTSQLVISATEKELDAVETLITKLDTQTKQILIEARFLEINKNPRTSKGIDWTDTLSQQNITFGNGLTGGLKTTTTPGLPTTLPSGAAGPTAPSQTTSIIDTLIGGASSPFDPLTGGSSTATPGLTANTANGFNPSTFFLNADGVKVALSFLNADSDAESIATPRAVTLENVPTELSVVRNIPVFEQKQGASTGNSTQPNTVKPNYVLAGPNGTILNEVGIKLMVTPRVYGGSNVFLDLRPEISDREVRPETTVLNGEVNTAPIFSRRKLQTQAMIPSGYTLVLGGLRQDNSSKSHTKVPFFGDLPGIGLAFRKDEKSRDKRDLVIFVTPTIISNNDFQPAANSREFLQQKMVDKSDAEWGPWDSGKPADWTKPDNSIKPKYTPGK